MGNSIFIANINNMKNYSIFANNIADKLKNNGYSGNIYIDRDGRVFDINGNDTLLTPDEAIKSSNKTIVWLGGAVISDEDLNKALFYSIINSNVYVGIWPFGMKNNDLFDLIKYNSNNRVSSDTDQLVATVLDSFNVKKEDNLGKSISN